MVAFIILFPVEWFVVLDKCCCMHLKKKKKPKFRVLYLQCRRYCYMVGGIISTNNNHSMMKISNKFCMNMFHRLQIGE